MPKPKIKTKISTRYRHTIYLPPEIMAMMYNEESHGISRAVQDTIRRYHELLHGTRTVLCCRILEGLED